MRQDVQHETSPEPVPADYAQQDEWRVHIRAEDARVASATTKPALFLDQFDEDVVELVGVAGFEGSKLGFRQN